MLKLFVLALAVMWSNPSSGANLRLTLDRREIPVGGGIGGYLEISNDGNDGANVEGYLTVYGGDLEYKIVKPDGAVVIVSKRTFPGSVWHGPRHRVMEPGTVLRVPVFLFTWDDGFIFDEPGTYAVTATLRDVVDGGDMDGPGTVSVGIAKQGYEQWKSIMLQEFAWDCAPFSAAVRTYDSIVDMGDVAKTDYAEELRYFFSYNSGLTAIPRFMRLVGRGEMAENGPTSKEVGEAILEGRSIAIPGTAAVEIWKGLEGSYVATWGTTESLTATPDPGVSWDID